MRQIFLLDDEDVLQCDDWCRPLAFESYDGGRSDFYAFESTYSRSPINNAKWVQVDQVFPAWVGKTLGQTRQAFDKLESGFRYEVVRGELPSTHTMLSREQRIQAQFAKDSDLDSQPLGFGKFAAFSPLALMAQPGGLEYLHWLALNTGKLSVSMEHRLGHEKHL